MEIKVSDYISSHRHKVLHEINEAEKMDITVAVVLNTDTGELYQQPKKAINLVPDKDCIIHICNDCPQDRGMMYINEIIEKISRTGKTLETGIIYANKSKAELINYYETIVNPQKKITNSSVNPIYPTIRYLPTVRQEDIDEAYELALAWEEEI